MLSSGNGIAVEPSSLGIAAKITAIGNSSRTRGRLTAGTIRISVLKFVENEEITSWTTYTLQAIAKNLKKLIHSRIDINSIQILYACLPLSLPSLNKEANIIIKYSSLSQSVKSLCNSCSFQFLIDNKTAF